MQDNTSQVTPPVVRVVLFDFDGTLTRPGHLDFASLKAEINCPPEETVLEFLASLEDREQKSRAEQILHRFEARAAALSQPNPGAEHLLGVLKVQKIPIGIITRNTRESVLRTLVNFSSVESGDFGVILCRDDDFEPKPSPQGVREAARRLGVKPSEMLLVGDHWLDVSAGHCAGAVTAFLKNETGMPPSDPHPDFILSSISDLEDLVRDLSPLPAGKLPNAFLEEVLGDFRLDDSTLLVPPAVGEDVAAVRIGGAANTLVLKTDPVTFASRRIALLAIAVNANDIATCGATPRWFTATVLLPLGTNRVQAANLLRDLERACSENEITLCGGHTEITPTVNQAIIAGNLVGTVEETVLLKKSDIRPGHQVVLTGELVVEGTALLAIELAEELRARGIQEEELEQAAQLLTAPGISIVRAAQLARTVPGVVAMHDVTEGGVATALDELSRAGNYGIRAGLDRLPVSDLTNQICRVLDLSPFGLIGSGNLLIVCKKDSSSSLVKLLEKADIRASLIGEVTDAPSGIEGVDSGGHTIEWPSFDRDELARALEVYGE